MLSLLADENLAANILRGVLRRFDGIDIVRVQDIGLTGADDPTILPQAGTGVAFDVVPPGVSPRG